MHLQEFFGRVLPSEGHFSLWEKSTKRHYWASSLDELVDLTNKVATGNTNWYFATAAFSSEQRTQACVLSKKCLYLDIDAGDEKFAKHGAAGAYPSQRDALLALNDFVGKTGIRPTMIVSSGDGLHVYWELDDAVPSEQWIVGARLLRQACKALGLVADHSCTMDSARILRPLGTLHSNGKEISLLALTKRTWGLNALIGMLHPYGDVLDAKPPKAVRDINSEVLDSFQGPPADVRKVLVACGALREAAARFGKDTSEPLWRAMLGLVKHCNDGDRAAHKLSCGHPNYDIEATQEKLDRWKVGPTTCDTFGEHSAACKTCEHRGKVTSPIQLGKMNDYEMKVQGIELPEPIPVPPPAELGIPPDAVDGVLYKIEPSGNAYALLARVKRKSVDASGVPITEMHYKPFCKDVFWIESWIEAGANPGEEAHVGAAYWRNKRVRRFNIPNKLVAQPSELLGLLLSQNINPVNTEPETKNLMTSYVNDQIQRIRNSIARPVVLGHYGFQRDKNTSDMVCAQGTHYITKDGTIWDALVSKRLGNVLPLGISNIGPSIDYKWSGGVWDVIYAGAAKQALFYRDSFTDPRHQLGIMLHIASLMMVFTADQAWGEDGSLPPTGFTLSMYSSETARGKSTVQKTAMEAFGSMGLVVAGGSNDMTVNAQVARAAMLGTYAYALDETTDSSPERVGLIINSIAGGSEKMRSNVEGGLQRKPFTWSLISSLSTNKPQRELLSQFQKGSDALQMRILELNFNDIPKLSSDELARFTRRRQVDLTANGGSLGAMISRYAVERGWEAMWQRGQDRVNVLFGSMDNPQEGRFFIRALAAMQLTCDILKELNLTIFDTQVLYDTFLTAYGESQTYRTEHATGGVPMVRRMVNDFAASILITRTDNGAVGGTDLAQNATSIKQPVVGRRVLDGRYMFLSSHAIASWCSSNTYSARQMVTDLKQIGAVTSPPDNVNLARGVDAVSGVDQLCFKIDLDRLNAEQDDAFNIIALRDTTQVRTSQPTARLVS